MAFFLLNKEWFNNNFTFYAQLFFLYARRKTQAMQGISVPSTRDQRSRKEKEQVENVKLLLNHSLLRRKNAIADSHTLLLRNNSCCTFF
ncbi:MAG: hypothetical protein AAF573_12110, partial [Bacteroidota bacterium]